MTGFKKFPLFIMFQSILVKYSRKSFLMNLFSRVNIHVYTQTHMSRLHRTLHDTTCEKELVLQFRTYLVVTMFRLHT